jgi:uncharacterized protein YjbI with pentapeptide repeats
MSNPEHAHIIERGVDAMNAFAAEHSGVTIDLSGADLAARRLSGLRIHGANLSRADLRGASLDRALLNGANLTSADLRGADLSGASLHRADISGADFRSVRFEAAFPPRLCVHDCSFVGVRWDREQIERFHCDAQPQRRLGDPV